jgi:protein-S-isoprenylcysteine O-methyltransferase Ste14
MSSASDSLSVKLGALLFRFRSVTPLPVIALGFALAWRTHIFPGPGGSTVDTTLNWVGLALCAFGSLVRLVTVAAEPRGSTQTRRIGANALHTSGPYAVVRHPLYLGNAFIVFGLLLITHAGPAYALVLPFFVFGYAFIIAAEERTLRANFGEAWTTWAAQVPALFPPRLSALPSLHPTAWRVAIRREVNPFVAWGLGATALLYWEWWARGLLPRAEAKSLQVVMLGFVTLLVANKVWKKVSP